MKRNIVFLTCILLMFSAFLSGCGKTSCRKLQCLHGVCNDGSCLCEAGWGGEFCTERTDPCDVKNCVNGICISGGCDCDLGYEGTLCDSSVAKKFEGEWTATEGCSPFNPSPYYDLTINPSGLDPTEVFFHHLNGFEGSVLWAEIGANGRSFTIPYQNYNPFERGSSIQGSGSMNASRTQITLTYTMYFFGSLDYICSATLTRQ